ncbi:MAG: hypothetical protein ACP5HK_01900 [Acidilobus sp.]
MSKSPVDKLLQAVIDLERSIREAEEYVKGVQAELIKRADSASVVITQEAARLAAEATKELEDLYRGEAAKIDADLAKRLQLVESDLRKRAAQNYERAVSAVIDSIKKLASGE